MTKTSVFLRARKLSVGLASVAVLACVAPTASACSWGPADQNVSEFLSNKTVFWGRATALKWDDNPNLKGNADSPNQYYEVEIIKPLQGNTGKVERVWTETGTCGARFSLGEIELFIVMPHQKTHFQSDGFLIGAANHTAVVSYLTEGIDTHTSAMPFAPGYQRGYAKWNLIGYEKACGSDVLANGVASNGKCVELNLVQKMRGIYEQQYAEVKAIKSKKPWWRFGRD